MLTNDKGFSLTELMIAIVIIGVLSMIAIPKFTGTTTKAKLSEFPAVLMQLYSLQDAHFLETDKYATSLEELDFSNPESKYFEYSISSDSKSFVAKATVIEELKDGQGNSLKGEFVSIDEKKVKGGSDNLRRVTKW